jgi:hypothetical protein
MSRVLQRLDATDTLRVGSIHGTWGQTFQPKQSLRTLSEDGTLQITSSSQIVFNFSHIQGAWHRATYHGVVVKSRN